MRARRLGSTVLFALLFLATRAGVVVATLVLGLRASATSYTFTPVDVPGAVATFALGINDAGEIVGSRSDESSVQAFLLSGGIYTTLEVPFTAEGSFANGINDAGQIVGGINFMDGSGAFLFENGRFTLLPPVSCCDVYAAAEDINDAGQILVGRTRVPGSVSEGFLYEAGSVTPVIPPGASSTVLGGIDDGGDIVGASDAPGFTFFLLSGGVYTALDLPSHPVGINDSGQILGPAWVWSNGVVTPLSVSGAIDFMASSINDAGAIVGWYRTADRSTHGFLATPVPEPKALLLFTLVLSWLLLPRQGPAIR